MSTTQRTTSCQMIDNCANPVTHIGEKGYIYCTFHALRRRASGYESTRKMRAWELRWINAGKTLPSYRPGAEPVAS